MSTPLHRERLDHVVRELLAGGATRVVDLGCGNGDLLQCLSPHRQFVRLLGVDIDEHALTVARSRLGIDLLAPDPRLSVRWGSFEDVDAELAGFDAAVLLETIEHVAADRLPRVEHAVFTVARPRLVLVTTPNRDYNPLHGMAAGSRRHPDHRFEWNRAQFRAWADGVATRNGYAVNFADLGPADPARGGSTQMASFAAIAASANPSWRTP